MLLIFWCRIIRHSFNRINSVSSKQIFFVKFSQLIKYLTSYGILHFVTDIWMRVHSWFKLVKWNLINCAMGCSGKVKAWKSADAFVKDQFQVAKMKLGPAAAICWAVKQDFWSFMSVIEFTELLYVKILRFFLKLFHSNKVLKKLQTQFSVFFLRKRHKNNKLSSGSCLWANRSNNCEFFSPKSF